MAGGEKEEIADTTVPRNGERKMHNRKEDTMKRRILSMLLTLCMLLSLLPTAALAAGYTNTGSFVSVYYVL